MRGSSAFSVSALLLTPTTAWAANSSATMAVSAEVRPNCTVSASPLNLVAGGAESSSSSRSAIAVICGPDEPFLVSLDNGRHAEGSDRMAQDPATLRRVSYLIYSDQHLTRRWDQGFGAAVNGTTDSLGRAIVPAYARLASGQAVNAGSYSDDITVTVSF